METEPGVEMQPHRWNERSPFTGQLMPDVTGKKTYEIQATAGYEEKKGSILPVVLAGVGILIGVIALILILYLLSRKKKEEKGTEEKTWNS